MSIFRRPDYESDTTQFIAQLKAKKPVLESEQRQGRELLWDKLLDRTAWRSYRRAEVAQKPYVYQTDTLEKMPAGPKFFGDPTRGRTPTSGGLGDSQ